MIVRHYSQSSDDQDGNFISGWNFLGKTDTSEASDFSIAKTAPPISTPPPISGELASGNLGFSLNDTGGAGGGTDAWNAFEQAVEL